MSKYLNPLTIIIAIIIIAGIVGTGYFYITTQRSQEELDKLKGDPNKLTQQINRELLEDVGKLVELPEGETPTIATVTDESRLADQPFFVNAKNGDKVLIFTEAKRAILYRPSTNKIIEIAPVRIGEDQPKTKKETETPTNP